MLWPRLLLGVRLWHPSILAFKHKQGILSSLHRVMRVRGELGRTSLFVWKKGLILLVAGQLPEATPKTFQAHSWWELTQQSKCEFTSHSENWLVIHCTLPNRLRRGFTSSQNRWRGHKATDFFYESEWSFVWRTSMQISRLRLVLMVFHCGHHWC